MESLINSLTLYDQVYKAEMAGHGVYSSATGRSPVTLDEYIATAVNGMGEVVADRSLMVVANQKFLIRGPERNPFWHGQDWMVYTPTIPTPLSVYGRTYMEDFASVAKTFTELTNLILDAVHTVSLKAWAVVPGMLLNPNQIAEGISPNKLFMLEEGVDPKMFAQALDLGTLPAETVQVWEMMKNELTEAAGVNEIGLGQFAPKGRTSATEISATQQSSSAIVRSVAQTIETRCLDLILDLQWKTYLQHASLKDTQIAAAAGPDMFQALLSQRRQLIQRPFTFQARGISTLLARQQLYQKLLQVFQVVGASPPLAQAFFQKVSIDRFISKLLELSGIDIHSLEPTAREQQMQAIAGQVQQAQQNSQGAPQASGPGQAQMGNLASLFNSSNNQGGAKQ